MAIDAGPSLETQDNEGWTTTQVGVATTTPALVPSAPSGYLEEVLVRCPTKDNSGVKVNVNNYLMVSFDSGSQYHVLSPGEFIGWGVKGRPQQISIKSNVPASGGGVPYEITLNRTTRSP